jgi:hypothetical protein
LQTVLAIAAACLATACLAGPAAAHEATVLYTGPVEALAFAAENRTDGPLACGVALAHWYSSELGQAPAGGSVEAALWVNPADGTVYLLNRGGDRMPVQTLWCGVAGRSWETRSEIPLARRADAAPGAIRVVCEGGGDRVECR